MTHAPSPTPSIAIQPSSFHRVSLMTAAVAAVFTFGTITVALPAWAMFLGWVGYSIGAETTRRGVANLISFLLGLSLGLGAGLMINLLTPMYGDLVTPLIIFGVTAIVLSLRNLAPINNPLAYFLGLISFFASGMTPSPALFAMLATAGVIGAFGAWMTGFLQSRVQSA